MTKREWLQSWINKGGNADVLEFIADIIYHGPDASDAVYSLFAAGYCYYFACMLKIAFKRGYICHAYPYDHIVWVDEDDIAYDIGGIRQEYEELIPIDDYGRALNGFRHVISDNVISAVEQHAIVEDIRKRTSINKYGRRY